MFKTKENVALNVELKMEEKTEPDVPDKKSFPTWAIIVIIVGGALILAVIIIIIVYRLKKDHVSAESIEKGNLLISNNEEN